MLLVSCKLTLASLRFWRTPGMKDLVNLTQDDPMAVAKEAMILTVVIIWGGRNITVDPLLYLIRTP